MTKPEAKDGIAFGEEEDVGFDAGAGLGKDAAGQADDAPQLALVEELLLELGEALLPVVLGRRVILAAHAPAGVDGPHQGAVALGRLAQLFLGVFPFGDVLEGLDRTGDLALFISDGRGGKKKPLAAFAQFSAPLSASRVMS